MKCAPILKVLAVVALTTSCKGGPSSCLRSLPHLGGSGGHEAPRVVRESTTERVQAFASEAELTGFLRKLAEAQERDRQRVRTATPGGMEAEQAAPSPAPAAEAPAGAAGSESVTNVQHAGVDEGGIVKVHGDYLVVLRRGRLFTVRIGDDSLAPVSAADAFGPGIDPRGAWYDEMLLSGSTVVVVGYSYQRGGTELGLFELDREGRISHRGTYHLRSNDYYSSRNYASRLIGSKLVFYTPLYLQADSKNLYRSFPAMRRWRPQARDEDFRRIVEPTRVYKPLIASESLALHTVTTCDLAQPELTCTSTAVMGPPGRVFYVSPTSVYVWMTDWSHDREKTASTSLVYRMPLDGSAPTALRAGGAPVDQFSFLESADEHLNVLVRAEGAGEGMWRAEVTAGDVALLRAPLANFTDDPELVPASRYAELPRPDGHGFHNRFVGPYILYGTGSGWGRLQQAESPKLYAYRYAGGTAPSVLDLGHGADRIEALGAHAVVVGADAQGLHFSPVALRETPVLAQRYTRTGATQGEMRSHGFFYKPESAETGMLGLPIRSGGSPGYAHLRRDSASVLFLRNESLRFAEMGNLASRSEGNADDGCVASCVDWYGNARPLFLRGRVFALLGYEIVEGEVRGGRIEERRRVSFAPGATIAR